MGKITPCATVVGLIALVMGLISCKNTDMMVIAVEPTRVFKSYPDSGPPKQDEVIAVLNRGEACAVIHSRYSKDFMFYKIRLKDGREGYVWAGDKFRVLPKTSNAP
ncbi:MAG: SH3 domain-containing protein [Deltaproteobacteria bacterium]|nr:SH3 domain-containing protein [Deltaproteobacteria bacterium]